MAADFENMGYEVVTKTVSRIKWPPNPIKGPRSSTTCPGLKMAVDFENMGYEAVPKLVSRIKMASESE